MTPAVLCDTQSRKCSLEFTFLHNLASLISPLLRNREDEKERVKYGPEFNISLSSLFCPKNVDDGASLRVVYLLVSLCATNKA